MVGQEGWDGGYRCALQRPIPSLPLKGRSDSGQFKHNRAGSIGWRRKVAGLRVTNRSALRLARPLQQFSDLLVLVGPQILDQSL